MKALLGALLLLAPATGGARPAAPAGPGGECIACHAEDYAGKAVIHPPVKNGLCTACHVSISETSHSFGLLLWGFNATEIGRAHV